MNRGSNNKEIAAGIQATPSHGRPDDDASTGASGALSRSSDALHPSDDRHTNEDSPQAVRLPRRVPRQPDRPVQEGLPTTKGDRDRLRDTIRTLVTQAKLVPPLDLDQLREVAARACEESGCGVGCEDYAAILVNNETWRDTLAGIPYSKRLLLLPQCLRSTEKCEADIDELGLVCGACGSCSIQSLQKEAESLGYAVLVAEGSAVVTKLIETGEIEAIVGVSCMDVLEKCFPHMEARAVPGMAIPLLQNGCENTSVDLDWLRDAMHLTAEDRTRWLDLESLKTEVKALFTKDGLDNITGPPSDETARIAQDWLARDGKRWRPYLTACVHMSLMAGEVTQPSLERDLRRLCVAVECFHKASLVHDDIEDDDDERYGQKALHAEYGVPVALNVGDFLLGEGYRLIAEIDGHTPDRTKVAMLQTAATGHLTLSRGQGAELCWAREPRPLSAIDVLDIFRKKTAPAFEVALCLGAHYAGADLNAHKVLSRYSEALGIAYQIRDDLEDFAGLGDSHDLRDFRPSLVLAIAHKRAVGKDEQSLTTSMWRRECDYDKVADQLRQLIARRNVIETVEDLLASYIDQATRTLQPLANPTLKGLLRRVIGRIFGNEPIQGYCHEHENRHAAGRQVGPGPAP